MIDLEKFNEEKQTDHTQQNNRDNTNQDLNQNNELTAMKERTNQDLDQNNELNIVKERNINWYIKKGRAIRTPQRYLNWAIHVTSKMQTEEYGIETAYIIGKVMYHLQNKDNLQNTCIFSNKHYSLKAGMH